MNTLCRNDLEVLSIAQFHRIGHKGILLSPIGKPRWAKNDVLWENNDERLDKHSLIAGGS